MKNTNYIVTILVPCLLVACGSTTRYENVWQKEGISAYDMESIQAQCQYNIEKDKISEEKSVTMLHDCMRSKGFRLKKIRVR